MGFFTTAIVTERIKKKGLFSDRLVFRVIEVKRMVAMAGGMAVLQGRPDGEYRSIFLTQMAGI